MASLIQDLLAKRRNRALAIILSFKEKECDHYLPDEVSEQFRKVVLDVVNDFSDFCNDTLKATIEAPWMESGIVLNDRYLEKLDEIHDILTDQDPK